MLCSQHWLCGEAGAGAPELPGKGEAEGLEGSPEGGGGGMTEASFSAGVAQTLPSSAGPSPAAGSLAILNPRAQGGPGQRTDPEAPGNRGRRRPGRLQGASRAGRLALLTQGVQARVCISAFWKGARGEGLCVPGLQMPTCCLALVTLESCSDFIPGAAFASWCAVVANHWAVVRITVSGYVCSYGSPLSEVSLFCSFSYFH